MAKHTHEQMVVYLTLWSHHYVGHARKHCGRHQICFYTVENDYNLLFDLAQIATILGFSNTAIYKVYLTTLLCRAYTQTFS